MFGCRVSWVLTPSIFFRIAPILLVAPQEKHPGTVSCTTLSAAPAIFARDIRKINVKKRLAIFFIISSAFAIDRFNYAKSTKDATAICD
jgi:hypothetical protein